MPAMLAPPPVRRPCLPPAGLPARLPLAPQVVLLDRGQPVEVRGKDIGALFVRHQINPESNLCYGEGGAGGPRRLGLWGQAAGHGGVAWHSGGGSAQAKRAVPPGSSSWGDEMRHNP